MKWNEVHKSQILHEATWEITVSESTRLCRAKYTVPQQQDILPSATEEPYTKLTVKLQYSATTRVRASLIFPRITWELPIWWAAQLHLSHSAGPLDFQSQLLLSLEVLSDTTVKPSRQELPADRNLQSISHRERLELPCQAYCSSWLLCTHECFCHHQTTWKTIQCGCSCLSNQFLPFLSCHHENKKCFWATSARTTFPQKLQYPTQSRRESL